MKKKKEEKVGNLSISEMRNLINKKVGMTVAHNLNDENPTEVREWIPTGSTWLDSIICRGKKAGIPVGKCVELAGETAAGKSYMACQIAANAQKMGILPIYFDSESAIDPKFLSRAGCVLEDLIYLQANSCEFVLETIEDYLKSTNQKMLFIWDSLANTPAISDIEANFDPQATMMVKPRVLSKGMAKLTIPLAEHQSTLLILNQLRTNVTRTPAEAMTTPFFTPGGKAVIFAYSLRIWLTARKAKAAFILDDKGYPIGSEVKAKLEKSRFGTQRRTCTFKILWGDEVKVQDEESVLEALKLTGAIAARGPWFYYKNSDRTEGKFQSKQFESLMKKDASFNKRIMELMDEEVIRKFDEREVEANNFYEEEAANLPNSEELGDLDS
jgi:recombination protein RecA